MLHFLTLMKVALRALRIAAVSWMALVVTAPGLSGMVLCIDAEGHFALEIAHQGRCRGQVESGNHRRHVGSSLVSSASVACCGDCVDVPLSLDTVSQLVKVVRHNRPLKGTMFSSLAEVCVAADGNSLRTLHV